jgi:hypothetical protein
MTDSTAANDYAITRTLWRASVLTSYLNWPFVPVLVRQWILYMPAYECQARILLGFSQVNEETAGDPVWSSIRQGSL